MVVMDFDAERQVFELSEREMKLLRVHPVWGVCERARAPQLYAYVVRQAAPNFELPNRPLRRKIEIRRQLAARDAAQVILGQLEPFIEEDARSFAEEAAAVSEPPEQLE